MAQEKCCQEGLDQEPGGIRNPEMTKGWGETVERPGIQHCHKELRPETAATRQNENKEHKWQTATIFDEGKDNLKWHQKVELRAAITSQKRCNTRENFT
jgi:hypothetical protein